MEQRDYFQRQIDQLGKVLARLLSELRGIKSREQLSYGMEISRKALKAELDADIDELMTMPDEDFIDFLLENKKTGKENLEQLANILLILADNSFSQQGKTGKSHMLYAKSLAVFEYLNNTGVTYSFDRHFKIERIKNVLN